ncbi:MAG: Na/Pi cotransporter family protein [Firmicutes bacterium]|nr:Na/Pi cotransporter family protein [Bacillota bacterium]
MDISDILTLLSGVALFLFGMSLMGDSLKKVAGAKLELVLYRLSSTPVKGILLGTGVTAVIQSSSATSVMVVGFVNSGMMKVKQAIGVIMGAIIGTSVTGWVICLSYLNVSGSGIVSLLSTDNLSAVMSVIGIILYMFSKSNTKKHVGGILLGFAVLMFGMKAMSGAVSDLRSDENFISFLTSFSSPVLGILVGAAFTSVLQSASAAIGILQALAATGAVSFDVALPIIMGIAIGAAVPVLFSALGASTAGKRTALIYLLVDVIGVVLFSAVFYSVNYFAHFGFMGMTMNPFSIAAVNSLFRIVIVLALTPFIALLEKMVVFLIKDEEDEDVAQIDRLEERFLAHPAIAIEQSRITINSMSEKVRRNIQDAIGMIGNYSDKMYNNIDKYENAIDRYEDKLGNYLVRISSTVLNEKESQTVGEYLHSITDLERMGDHALNIAQTAREIAQKKVNFSEEGDRDLKVLLSAVSEIVDICAQAFVNDDLEKAYMIEPLEFTIDRLCDRMKTSHIVRLKNGQCTLEHGFIFNDLLTDLERISDHCSNIGIAIIENNTSERYAHEYSNELKHKHTKRFDEYLEEYSEKYSLKS